MYSKPVFTLHDQREANTERDALYHNFESFCRQIAYILRLQLSLPKEKWCINPVAGAGIAGGEKYIVGHVFAKFARDDPKYGLYGGDDEKAAKMAKNELRHASSLLALRLPQLHTSMIACVQVLGHTIFLTPLIPVSKASLVMGSQDAAKTVYDLDATMRHLSSQVAAAYNLAHHSIARHPPAKQLPLAVDVEGHVSPDDGRHYIIDLGRMFPTNATKAPEIWYCVYRPEYLRLRAAQHLPPISSDSRSAFGVAADEPVAKAAREHYFHIHIPSVLERLLLLEKEDQQEKEANHHTPSPPLAVDLHQAGINLRHLGLLWTLCERKHNSASGANNAASITDDPHEEQKEESQPKCKLEITTTTSNKGSSNNKIKLSDRLLREMVYRAAKSVRRQLLRNDRQAPPGLEAVLEHLPVKYPEMLPYMERLAASDLVKDSHRAFLMDCLESDAALSGGAAASKDGRGAIGDGRGASSFQVDVVQPPPFLSLEAAEQGYLQDLQLREAALRNSDQDLRPLIPTLTVLLALYEAWHEKDPEHTRLKAQPVLDKLTALADEFHIGQALGPVQQFYSSVGDYEKGEAAARKSLQFLEEQFGKDHTETAIAITNLAMLQKELGRYEEARVLLERALAINESKFGLNHRDVAASLHRLAALYTTQGRHRDALPLHRRSLRILEDQLGPNHIHVAASLTDLGDVLGRHGQYTEALPLLQRALQIREHELGPTHPEVARALGNLALMMNEMGQPEPALELLERALKINEAHFGPAHSNVANSLNCQARVHFGNHEFDAALPLFLRALSILESVLGAEHSRTAEIVANVASLHNSTGRHAEALPLFERACSILERNFGPQHPEVAGVLNNTAICLSALGRHDEALAAMGRSCEIQETYLGPDHPQMGVNLWNIAGLLEKQGDLEGAIPLVERAHAIVLQGFGENHPHTKAMKAWLDRIDAFLAEALAASKAATPAGGAPPALPPPS